MDHNETAEKATPDQAADELVALQKATAELNGWMDFKRMSASKRKSYTETADSLVANIQAGILSIDDQHVITHRLCFPVTDEKGEVVRTTLKYKPRIQVADIQTRTKNLKASDMDGRIQAIIGALTSENTGILAKLDTEDSAIAQNIALFFV